MDVDGIVKIARDNPEVVKGVKVIVAPRTVQSLGLKHVEASKRAAREAGIRMMMHVYQPINAAPVRYGPTFGAAITIPLGRDKKHDPSAMPPMVVPVAQK